MALHGGDESRMGGLVSIPRIHTDLHLAPAMEIPATPGQLHHLGVVLRRGVGDAVRLFNAQDGEWEAEIAAMRRERGMFRLGAQLRPGAAEPELTLVVAALKRDAMDWVVEKATELGVTAIRPVLTRRSVASHANIERLGSIARGAAEQCERLGVPRIEAALALHSLLDGWRAGPLLVAAERRAAPPLAAAMAGLAATAPRALLVGPEGGFTPEELDDLAARPFVSLCRLGPRILRAETAAVAGLAALQALAGDWAE
ncbi:16S rRNA (uracil(1498)-N(3))-methyltransferase [Rhodovarius sp.]|uniref:16S rRNA (uracil(1498)-N(3))-methyltransferase n=1 Tax=Rhodovarius sp. TaxID=2972673 RepID=UPI003342973D